MLWQFHFQRTIKTKYINIYPFLADGRLLGFVEGPRAQQALPRARGAEHVLHRAAEVPVLTCLSSKYPILNTDFNNLFIFMFLYLYSR